MRRGWNKKIILNLLCYNHIKALIFGCLTFNSHFLLRKCELNVKQPKLEDRGDRQIALQRKHSILNLTVFKIVKKDQVKYKFQLLVIDLPINPFWSSVNNRNTRTICEICSKLKIKITDWRHWRRSLMRSSNHIFKSQ